MLESILVGDIGSSKSTWWYQSPAANQIHLEGYNPLAHTEEAGSRLFMKLRSAVTDVTITGVWYYGAGIIDQHVASGVRKTLQDIFAGCPVHVASDLSGAAFAACGHQPGAVAILGTGSHAAAWDGSKITRQATSLGYILGDEGGGCDIGKKLIQAYFYSEMPDEISGEMDARIPTGRSGLLTSLQASETPNQYLAEFARVAVLFQEHPWIREVVASRFKLFVNRHIKPLETGQRVHIVGSIGCIFASLIEQELEKIGLTPGLFIKDPAQRLFERHLEHGQKEI